MGQSNLNWGRAKGVTGKPIAKSKKEIKNPAGKSRSGSERYSSKHDQNINNRHDSQQSCCS